MNTGKFSFRRLWLVLRWQFLAGWRTLAVLAAASCLVMILVMSLAASGVFGQDAVESIADIFGSFAAGILIGVVFTGGLKASEHIRNRNRRREILLMPALDIEKAAGVLLYYVPVLPLTAFAGLKTGVLAFKGILGLLSSSAGDIDMVQYLQAHVSAGAAGGTHVFSSQFPGIMMLALWGTSALLAGMYFRKGYMLSAVILCLLEMISLPVAIVLVNEKLMESEPVVLVLSAVASALWCILNLCLSYRIFRNAEIAECGITRTLFCARRRQ